MTQWYAVGLRGIGLLLRARQHVSRLPCLPRWHGTTSRVKTNVGVSCLQLVLIFFRGIMPGECSEAEKTEPTPHLGIYAPSICTAKKRKRGMISRIHRQFTAGRHDNENGIKIERHFSHLSSRSTSSSESFHPTPFSTQRGPIHLHRVRSRPQAMNDWAWCSGSLFSIFPLSLCPLRLHSMHAHCRTT